ncbi:MAG: hypothetical protein K0Q69_3193, partial [Devosia sp.]|nr:hypothetical protein [Devosia sp.]
MKDFGDNPASNSMNVLVLTLLIPNLLFRKKLLSMSVANDEIFDA